MGVVLTMCRSAQHNRIILFHRSKSFKPVHESCNAKLVGFGPKAHIVQFPENDIMRAKEFILAGHVRADFIRTSADGRAAMTVLTIKLDAIVVFSDESASRSITYSYRKCALSQSNKCLTEEADRRCCSPLDRYVCFQGVRHSRRRTSDNRIHVQTLPDAAELTHSF